MPGTVKISAAPKVERFLANQVFASPGVISSGRRTLTVRNLIVRFGIDDPPEGITIVAMSDRRHDGVEVAVFVGRRRQHSAHRIDEDGIPLRVKARARLMRGQRVMLFEVFGDGDLPGMDRADLAIDPV